MAQENALYKKPLDTKQKIEQVPFQNQGTQMLLHYWCDVNDSIVPVFLSREAWLERKGSGWLVPKKWEKGDKRQKKNLYLPTDLHLWEMPLVIDLVEVDTFREDPDRSIESRERMHKTGQMFRDTGIYLAQQVATLIEGREIAQQMAETFYTYGAKLLGETSTESSIEDIAAQPLSKEDLQKVDRWLAGSNLYQQRLARVEASNALSFEERERALLEMRQKTIAQFFRLANQAMNPDQPRSITAGSLGFQRRVDRAIDRAIEAPRAELNVAILRRGLESLVQGMKEAHPETALSHVNEFFKKFGIPLELGERNLAESVGLSSMKQELLAARAGGDVEAIAEKELEIAGKIQASCAKFSDFDRFDPSVNSPVKVLMTQKMNCTGFTMLGYALQKAVGLNLLVARMPNHLSTFLVTTDGRIFDQEMQFAQRQTEITDEDIFACDENKRPVTIKDIAALSHTSVRDDQGLEIKIISDKAKRAWSWVFRERDQRMIINSPEAGIAYHLLSVLFFKIDWTDRGMAVNIEAKRQKRQMGKDVTFGIGDSSFESFSQDSNEITLYRHALETRNFGFLNEYVKANELYYRGFLKEARETYKRLIENGLDESLSSRVQQNIKNLDEQLH